MGTSANLHSVSLPSLTSPPAAGGPTRVLEVVGNAIVGGMENCVLRLIEQLPRERFAVTVLCPCESRFTERLRALDVDVLTAAMPDDPPWASIMTTCALVRASGIDVLHAHMPNAHLLAGLVGKLCGKPVVATVHSRHVTPMDLEVHRLAGTHLSVVCRHSQLHALSMGIDAAQLSCIPNGVDTQAFRPRDGLHGDDGDLRRHFALAEADPLIGFVGRLSPEKGPEVFLRAALLLRATLPRARFVLVGDGPLRASVQQFVERFGLGDAVLLAGVREDMPAVWRQLDALVNTSQSEAMPLALMEAMASGLPVVASHVGGVPDLVESGGTGWLTGPRDAEGVAHHLAQLFQTPGLAARMGAQARARAVARFGLADSVQRTAALLAQLGARGAGLRTAIGAVGTVGGTGPAARRSANAKVTP
jgi:glycosyltransferase involved in cell wall biosynthesis